MLVLTVGPSGAGKDTLLAAAKTALSGDTRFRFARRVITRQPQVGNEDFEPVTEEEFGHRSFALQWQAHGLSYGIPLAVVDDLARGLTVVANVSRTVISEAALRFPTGVIEITAPAELLGARLRSRGRENAGEVAQRLARSMPLPSEIKTYQIINDGSIVDGVARFLAALDDLAPIALGQPTA